MKILWVLGSVLFLVMGGMIYLSYSLNHIMDPDQSLLVITSSEEINSKNIFQLPPAEIKKKLDQLNELKNISKENRLERNPAQDDQEQSELSTAIRDYNLSIALIMSEQYRDLVNSPQGLSMEEIEERRLQILQHKKLNDIIPEFIETIPFDSILAVKMTDKNIEELEVEEIQKIRESFSYVEIKNYFDKKNKDSDQ